MDAVKKEQEDLLVLLADQDTKIRDYRRRLGALGQSVSEDESESESAEAEAEQHEHGLR